MTSIFVAKLDFNTTDEELKSLFEEYGRVNRVTIAKDRETGKPRGFAFVEMPDESEAEAAIDALDNSSVNGRTIAVKKADDRGARPPGPGGPGGPPRTDSRPPRPDFNRGPRTDDRPPRPDDSDIPFRKPEDGPRPFAAPDAPAKSDRKKEKDVFAKKSSDKPKQHKMEAYKKSGKAPRFLDDDDDDDWSLNSRRGSAWDEEE